MKHARSGFFGETRKRLIFLEEFGGILAFKPPAQWLLRVKIGVMAKRSRSSDRGKDYKRDRSIAVTAVPRTRRNFLEKARERKRKENIEKSSCMDFLPKMERELNRVGAGNVTSV